jgi:DNA invertase Pin-like site-specific DNA recombinase
MNFIAYYRVSTAQQGRSGLGIEAQKSCVSCYVNGRGKVVAEYTEVESGKVDARPELAKAIAHTKRINATLVVGKLDRLSRSVSTIFALRDSGVSFVACDLPEANTLTIGVIAAMAQHEREVISQRTKSALGALKARGVKLGNPQNLTADAIKKGAATRTANALANPANRIATELAMAYKANGMSLSAIARKLNENGHATRRGKTFDSVAVRRLLDRAKAKGL